VSRIERMGVMTSPGRLGPSVHEQRQHELLAGRANAIIASVLTAHRLHRDDFFGPYREPHLVAARAEAARRLAASGMSASRIGRVLNRHYTTVLNYLGLKDRKRQRLNERAILRRLDPELRPVVEEIAAAESVTIETLIAQWVGERARFEVYQRTINAA
jgi:predicted transcriptional regulator